MQRHQEVCASAQGLAAPVAAEDPTKDKAGVQAGFAEGGEKIVRERRESATLVCPVKRWATVAEQLWRHGYQLNRSEGGPVVIRRWDLAETLPDLEAAELFARAIGASS